MTDLEITRLCAQAIGIDAVMLPIRGKVMRWWFMTGRPRVQTQYNPLQDDAQAMALVKHWKLDITHSWKGAAVLYRIRATASGWEEDIHTGDLNRAICECVAKVQAARA